MAIKLRYGSATEGVTDVNRKHDCLLRSLRVHLLPVFVQHGFNLVPLVFRRTMSREYKETFPLGHFVRPERTSSTSSRLRWTSSG